MVIGLTALLISLPALSNAQEVVSDEPVEEKAPAEQTAELRQELQAVRSDSQPIRGKEAEHLEFEERVSKLEVLLIQLQAAQASGANSDDTTDLLNAASVEISNLYALLPSVRIPISRELFELAAKIYEMDADEPEPTTR